MIRMERWARMIHGVRRLCIVNLYRLPVVKPVSACRACPSGIGPRARGPVFHQRDSGAGAAGAGRAGRGSVGRVGRASSFCPETAIWLPPGGRRLSANPAAGHPWIRHAGTRTAPPATFPRLVPRPSRPTGAAVAAQRRPLVAAGPDRSLPAAQCGIARLRLRRRRPGIHRWPVPGGSGRAGQDSGHRPPVDRRQSPFRSPGCAGAAGRGRPYTPRRADRGQ